MKGTYTNLLAMDFLPLSEVKPTLSEQIRKLRARSQRIAITSNGRPVAVLMTYADYLKLARNAEQPSLNADEVVLDFADWKRGEKKRKAISASIDRLFDVSSLSRKGQKPYKRVKLDEFSRTTKKRTD